MNEAQQKNHAALCQALGDAALIHRLESCRIGIWSDSASMTQAGRLLAEALGEVLGRFWLQIDAQGPLAPDFLAIARQAAASGNLPIHLQDNWHPNYDFVIAIGTDLPAGASNGRRIGASGWQAMAGANAYVDDDPNPVGPAAAAAIAAMETFKALFADALGDRAQKLPSDFSWSAWDYGAGQPAPTVQSLHFDDVHIIGVGAVTHGLLWVLERWPGRVTGRMHQVDHDRYDVSNGHRYVGMRAEDRGQPKSAVSTARLCARHPGLTVLAHPKDMNRYFQEDLPDGRAKMVVAGLDSKEHRRQLALKLPLRVINMWTEENRLGAARFGFSGGWPCLYCAYPENPAAVMDETGELVRQTGLSPRRVRDLLFSGRGLEMPDIDVLRQRGMQADQFLGKPLRSVAGILCATGHIPLPEAGREATVPFAFASFLAGIGGFIELVREIWNVPGAPGHWQANVFHPFLPGNWWPRAAHADCDLCGDSLTHQVLQDKFGRDACLSDKRAGQ